jgi:N-acetylmuramoyl-L-alanine amidase
MVSIYWYFNPGSMEPAAVLASTVRGGSAFSAPIVKPVPARVVRQRFAQSPPPFNIGIIVGHRGNDSGAVCDDGLTELSINTTIAEKVLTQLTAAGYNAILLDEFDIRLNGYEAVALVSIHADSCGYYGEEATGYKVAGSSRTDSIALVDCLNNSYAQATGLSIHLNTITTHMTDYHAFREIGPGTPAAIVETGFMYKDRDLLTLNSDIPAAGITAGIICFVETQR